MAVARDDAGGAFIERIEAGAARWRGYRDSSREQRRLTGRSGPRTTRHMTEQKEQTKPTKPLTLSTTTRTGAAAKGGSDATQVRQKFSHGRTRVVAVEVKKPVKRPPGARACGRCSRTRACRRGQGAGGADRPYPQAGRRCGRDRRAPCRRVRRPVRHPLRRRRRAEDADRGREGSARPRPGRRQPRRRGGAPARRPGSRPPRHRGRGAQEGRRGAQEAPGRGRRAQEVRGRGQAQDRRAGAEAPGPGGHRLAAGADRPPGRGDQCRAAPQAAPAAPAAPIRRPLGAPGAGQSTEAALRRPPMRPAIVNKRLPQPPGARREVPKRRSDKVDVGRAVEGENDFRSRSAAQMRRRLERDRRREHANDGRSRRSIARSRFPRPSRSRSWPSACPSAAPTSSRR